MLMVVRVFVLPLWFQVGNIEHENVIVALGEKGV